MEPKFPILKKDIPGLLFASSPGRPDARQLGRRFLVANYRHITDTLITDDEILAVCRDPLGKQAVTKVKSGDIQV
jgi:hypothetical protein